MQLFRTPGTLFIAAAAVLCAGGLQGVAAQDLGVAFRAGASAPLGSYAASEGAEAGHVGAGFGLGLDLELRIFDEFSLVGSAASIFNSPRKSLLEGRNVAFDDGVAYIHFPLMAGPRVRIPLGSVTLAGIAQAGVVIVDGPAEHGMTDASQVPLSYVGYDMTPNFGLGGGLEIETEGRWRIGGRYLIAPSATFTANASRYGEWPATNEELTRTVSLMEIYVGYRVL